MIIISNQYLTSVVNKQSSFVILSEIISLFDDFNYKKLNLQSPYFYKSKKVLNIFCVKCFIDHGKFVKKKSIKKLLHHIDSIHQKDCNINPTSKQVKRLIEIFSIKLQIEELNLKNNFTKKQQYQIEKIGSVMSELGMLRGT